MNGWEDMDALRSRPRLRVLGLMSGMSRDGLDLALVDIERAADDARPTVTPIASRTVAYDPALRARLMAAPQADVAEVARLDFELAHTWSALVHDFLDGLGEAGRQVDLIGSHGQTIHHTPAKDGHSAVTLQVGHGDVLAEATGLCTVSDFRVRDIAAGGEGAPLIPYADWVRFAADTPRLCQNLGSIGNVTVVTPALEDCLAFDTGPANALIDGLAATHDDTTLGGIDRDGALSASGTVDDDVLLWLWTERARWLVASPPKSAGFNTFGPPLAQALRAAFPDRGLADLVRTAVAFTANTIRDAYERHVMTRVAGASEVVLSGGGTRNATLVQHIEQALAPLDLTLRVLDDEASDAKEAIGFALLAEATLRGVPANVLGATGACGARILGRVSLGGRSA